MTSHSQARVCGAVLSLALLLTGCGLFGDSDATASSDDPIVVEAPTSVRVEAGDRWFDIDPGTVDATSLDELAESVDNLGIDEVPAVDAAISFDQANFVVVPSVDGAEPDVDALLEAIANLAPGTETIEVPFKPVRAELSDAFAQEYVDELNGRLGDGVQVAFGDQTKQLPASTVGPATSVTWSDDAWDLAVDFSQIEDDLANLFPNVGAEGGEASFTVEPGETEDDPATVVIVAGQSKTICCDESSVERIEWVLTTDLEVARVRLANVDADRGVAWAESLGIDELVGTFRTRYTPGQSRNINIQRIAELTTGVVIEPGETFSLNEFVGPRTRAKGFVPAGTIINGHLIDSVGGGISQYATTIFNAAFFAGLEFEAYQSHSIYFSRYPYGREATISWPAPALKIHNPTPYGVLIWPTATDNGITVDLYSTKWVDAEQTGQSQRTIGVACTRVTTERTRTFLDGKVDVDSVIATYREEGIACDGTETVNPEDTTTTTTSIDPNAPTTSVDPNAPTTSVDPNAPTTTVTTTTVDPAATTTTVAPDTTTSTTTTVAPETTTTTLAPTDTTTSTTSAPDTADDADT